MQRSTYYTLPGSILTLLTFCMGLILLPNLASTAQSEGIYARLHTSRGIITAKLHYDRAPLTVMNFIGLAEGTTNWRHPVTEKDGKRPLYRDLTFHNVKDFMIQTGDPSGTGKGGPGFEFDDEFHPELTHNKAGTLSMANRGRNTNGSQFFITTKPAPWLDRRYTLFGSVTSGMDIVALIRKSDKLEKIEIIRNGIDAKTFDTARAHLLSDEIKTKLKEASKKNLPEPSSSVDPERVPAEGQELVSPGDFDFLVVGHTEMKVASKLNRVFYYDHKGAINVAAKLVRLARSEGADFGKLIAKFSDMKRDTTSRGIKDSPFAPASLKPIFRLKPGQISDPVDLPTGVYIFRRLAPEAKSKS